MYKTLLLSITLFFRQNKIVECSNIKNSIISRFYVQTTIQNLVEEFRLEIPFTVMSNVQDYPIEEIPNTINNYLIHSNFGHEMAIVSYAFFVIFAKYQICIPKPSKKTPLIKTIKTDDLKKLHPFIEFQEFNKIKNETKTTLLIMLVLFFKNVSPVF